MKSTEVAVVGCGPAGLSCALTLAEYDVDVTLVDEQSRPGGQIYRQPPETFQVSPDPAYSDGAVMIEASTRKRFRWELESTVWGVFSVGVNDMHRGRGAYARSPATAVETAPELVLALYKEEGNPGRGRVERLRAGNVLLAPGAYDLPVAFPGWTLPGVMAAGGVQAFVKSQRFLPGRRFCFVGSHPLQLLVAEQLMDAGGEIAAVFFAQPRPTWIEAIRGLPQVMGSPGKLVRAWDAWRRLQRAGVRIEFQKMVRRALGDVEVRSAVIGSVDRSWRIVPDTDETIQCETLALNYGFLPSTELGRQAGCRARWEADAGGWVLEHDPWMQSSVPRLFLAGEITGIGGADVARLEGRLAALGILRQMGRLTTPRASAEARRVRRKLRGQRRFARALNAFAAPDWDGLARLVSDDTLVCRCEEIRAGPLRRTLRDHPHLTTANAAKLLTRTGMGPCQGRFCMVTLTGIIAHERGSDRESVGTFSARPPAKPIPLDALAAYWRTMEHDEDDVV